MSMVNVDIKKSMVNDNGHNQWSILMVNLISMFNIELQNLLSKSMVTGNFENNLGK